MAFYLFVFDGEIQNDYPQESRQEWLKMFKGTRDECIELFLTNNNNKEQGNITRSGLHFRYSRNFKLTSDGKSLKVEHDDKTKLSKCCSSCSELAEIVIYCKDKPKIALIVSDKANIKFVHDLK